MIGWRRGADRLLSNDTYTFYVASEEGTVDMKINHADIFSNHVFSDPAEANSSTNLCKGWHNFAIWYHHATGNASFADLSLGDNITEWRWNFGDGTPDEIYNASTNPTHNYGRAGVYNATLTVVNGTGGMSTHSELVDMPIKGDANHDEKLSTADAVLILQMAACGINSDPAADVNSDGAITSLDALMVSQDVIKGVNDE